MLHLFVLCAPFARAESAEKPREESPVVDQVARSLLNVTDYISSYLDKDGKGVDGPSGPPPSVDPLPPVGGDFMPNAKKICAPIQPDDETVGFQLHLLQGSLAEAKLAANTAFWLPVEFDAMNGDVGGMEKVYFDNFASQAMNSHPLKEELTSKPDFAKAAEDAKAGTKSREILGKAELSRDLKEGASAHVVFTGGTSADRTLVSDGTQYFGMIQQAYYEGMERLATQAAKVDKVVLTPLGLGSQFQPDWVVSPDVLVFYAGNFMTWWMKNTQKQGGRIKDVYLVATSPEETYAMCKYCQYRTFASMDAMATVGLCADARAHVGAASPVWLFSVVVVMLWW